MKVQVDQSKCGTVGLCVKACPEVFRFQEGSKKAAAFSGEVPSELEAKVLKAVNSCPNGAIVIITR
jgi:ferredoxin